jgi:uracil-DNA glycosylase family 4
MITNAVRCAPPANRPTPSEMAHCRQFLQARIAALPKLRTILALGRIAHDGTLDALGLKRRGYTFAHGARHDLPTGQVLFDSYHCSRQNTNTGRLTTSMFEAVLATIAGELGCG